MGMGIPRMRGGSSALAMLAHASSSLGAGGGNGGGGGAGSRKGQYKQKMDDAEMEEFLAGD